MKVQLVKLGGSLITDKRRRRTIRRRDLERICGEIVAATRRMRTRTILGHGSGSFGHMTAAEHRIQHGLRRSAQRPGASATQAVAALLHQAVTAELRAQGGAPLSYVPSSAMLARRGTPVGVNIEPLLAALRSGFLPVTHGDLVLDRVQGVAIASTEAVILALAGRLQRRGVQVVRALWFGDTDGILGPDGRPQAHVDRADRATLAAIGGPRGTDVTGGMRLRLDTALALARLGIPSLIANGGNPGLIADALRGRPVPGTRVGA